jgi:hypothetical protein
VRGLGLGSVGPGSWMMISLLADVTRHLTIATFIFHCISSLSDKTLALFYDDGNIVILVVHDGIQATS